MSFCSGINAILFAPIQFDSKFCFIFCPLSQDSYLFILYLLSSLVSSPRVRNLVQAEWVLQGADDMFVAVTSSYLSPLLSFYETPY